MSPCARSWVAFTTSIAGRRPDGVLGPHKCLDHIIVMNEQHLTGVTKATEEPSGCRGAGRGALARPLRNCAGWSRNAA